VGWKLEAWVVANFLKGLLAFSQRKGASTHVIGAGGIARVDAATHRQMHNAGDGEAIVLVVGGELLAVGTVERFDPAGCYGPKGSGDRRDRESAGN